MSLEIDRDGNRHWYNDEGELHRENGPAFEGVNGYKEWHINGEFHRLDGPAVEYIDGDKYWFKNGKLHRIDGPAVEGTSGEKWWFRDGKPIKKGHIKALNGDRE